MRERSRVAWPSGHACSRISGVRFEEVSWWTSCSRPCSQSGHFEHDNINQKNMFRRDRCNCKNRWTTTTPSVFHHRMYKSDCPRSFERCGPLYCSTARVERLVVGQTRSSRNTKDDTRHSQNDHWHDNMIVVKLAFFAKRNDRARCITLPALRRLKPRAQLRRRCVHRHRINYTDQKPNGQRMLLHLFNATGLPLAPPHRRCDC